MIKIITAFLIIISCSSFAHSQKFYIETVPTKGGSPYYEKVFKVDSSISKDHLFTTAKIFFAKHFLDSKAVLEVEDKEAGRLVGKGVIKVYRKSKWQGDSYLKYWVVFDMLIKQGKYRVRMIDFTNYEYKTQMPLLYGGTDGSWFPTNWEMLVKKSDSKQWAFDLIEEFHIHNIHILTELRKEMRNGGIDNDTDF